MIQFTPCKPATMCQNIAEHQPDSGILRHVYEAGESMAAMGWHIEAETTIFQTTFSSTFSWMKMHKFWLRFNWILFLRVQLTISQHWFRLGTGQVTSHYLKQWQPSLLMHICLTRPQWVNLLPELYMQTLDNWHGIKSKDSWLWKIWSINWFHLVWRVRNHYTVSLVNVDIGFISSKDKNAGIYIPEWWF